MVRIQNGRFSCKGWGSRKWELRSDSFEDSVQ